MLPNRFPDAGEQPEYNAVDASLWYVVAVHELLEAAGAGGIALAAADRQAAAARDRPDRRRLPRRHALRHPHGRTTGCSPPACPGVQLTWMDAKVGDWVVTPRIGKPVEVQALWLNALRIAGASRPEYCALYRHALASFQLRFWNDAAGCLYDVVDVDHVPGRHDPAVRPNQILAVGGLPHQVLVEPYASRVVETVERRLLTPLGLRSLAPGEPGYRPHYGGGVCERDAAYHQGTVWPWLIGPFVEAWLRVRGDTPDAKREADERFLSPLRAHLGVAGLGHVSEIADAEPPHRPRGCPFQAWSLGELLRARRLVADEPAKEVAQRPRNRVPAPQAERRTGSSPMLLKDDSDGTRPTGRRAERAGLNVRSGPAWPRMRGRSAGSCWGPYLSERQWGTVREDYSPYGNAWEYFPHDQARSRAYRWGEDGIAGISDRSQRLCLALALWNGKDPILKERLFGLTNGEGNHSEDVKELYYYLDATPTHSYLKYLYKYPQARISVQLAGRGEPTPRQGAARVRADRYRRVRRRPLLRRVRRIRQGGRRRHPDAGHGAQPRPRTRASARPAAALVPQHLVMARRREPPRSVRRQRRDHRGQEQAVRRLRSPRRRRADAAVLRQRHQCPAAVRGRGGRRAISRTRSTSIWSPAGRTP